MRNARGTLLVLLLIGVPTAEPSDLLRAENNGQAARLADRHDRVGKIAAL
jgi:hypothetical protein